MEKPLVCFISYNRRGTAATNLKALLDNTKDDFDLCIVDNGSTDGIWEYLNKIKDERIAFKKHFDKNYGGVYAANYGLSKRKKYQPYILLENDIWIEEPHWIEKFQKTRDSFPDLGFIGANTEVALSSVSPSVNNNIKCYYSTILGSCTYLVPELIDLIGYWNEECYGGDNDLNNRILLFTPYKVAYTCEFFIKFRPYVYCSECVAQKDCPFDGKIPNECCTINYSKLYVNKPFASLALSQTKEYIDNIKQGKCSIYSASIHDEESRKNHQYNYEAAKKNFDFFNNFTISHQNN